jgi:ABC-2 type transport system permease protein
MKTVVDIAVKELRILLSSLIGWLILAVIAMEMGTALFHNLTLRASFAGTWDEILSMTFALVFQFDSGLVAAMLQHLYMFVPLITMGLLSQEYAKGTIKLLLSSPVSVHEIVLGKFLSVAVYALLLAALLFFFELLIGLFVIESMDLKVAFWGLVMVYLMICLYAAVGLFVSSLTAHPFVAALGSVGVLFGLQYLSALVAVGDSVPPVLAKMTQWFSVLTMFSGSSSFTGYLHYWQLLYFPIMIGLFLGLTWMQLYSRMRSESLRTKLQRYLALALVFVAIGTASVPFLNDFYFNVRGSHSTDTRILISGRDLLAWRGTLLYGIPATLLLAGGILVVRRRHH